MARTPEHAPQIPHIPIPDLRGTARWALSHWKPVGLALAAFTGGTYLALAHDRGPQSTPPEPNKASDTFKPPEGGVVIPPQSPDNPSVSAPSGTELDRSDKPKPPEAKLETTPCLITTPELCAQAERIQIKRPWGMETYLAFNPDQRTPFFAPEDVQLLDKVNESGDPFSGLTAILRKAPPGGAYIIIGLEFDNMIQVKDPKKGNIIGYSNSTGTKNFGANVLVTATKRTPSGPVTDEDALRELFPAAFEKPTKQTFTQKTPGIPNVSISYDSKPPQ